MTMTRDIAHIWTKRYNNNDDDLCCNGYGCYECNSTWNNWARWLVLAIIIIAAILIFAAFSCVSARRRRQHGHAPYRGTAWTLGRTPPGHNPAAYNANYNPQPYYNNSNNPPPPPAYTPAPAPNTYGGYYAKNTDVELQQPPQAYGGYRTGGEPAYEPPSNPPPNRV